ncbi:MAG TPA: DNA repair protein RecN [Nevskiaceae bacterium]|nr:DNA repair protein RecN [Nevskiaceae bacterium]
MLRRLQIRQLAVIESLDLEFHPGFTVLTGETGAGKSILLDALGLVTGMRAESGLVRQGAERAEVSAEFDLEALDAVRTWLVDQALDDPDEPALLRLRRVVAAEGRTRAFVNGSAVSTGQLRELGEQLIEIFGQHDSQTLLKAEVQRQQLDDYGVPAERLQACAEAAADWQRIERELRTVAAAGARPPAELDYLRHQVQELRALDLREGELDQLEQEHRRLANAGRLLGEGEQVQELLYGEAGAYDRLAEAARLLAGLAELDPALAAQESPLQELLSLTRDTADAIKRSLSRLDLDPAQLATVEERLAALHDLARKHRLRPEQLPAHLAALEDELAAAEQAGERRGGLEAALARAGQRWQQAAADLHQARLTQAGRLQAEVVQRVRRLGLPHADFAVEVLAEAGARPRADGADEVRYLFSANPGQGLRPLARTASGGELSRVSLALQVVLQSRSSRPVMVFDEIDAGIGGAVAEIVGRELRALGAHRQVLCVTHLAQVAAQGDRHCAIRKAVRDGQTYTQVAPLAPAQRIEEIGRMLGGETLTAATRAMAEELLARPAAAERPRRRA